MKIFPISVFPFAMMNFTLFCTKLQEDYRGVANRAALLFFALGELFKVHSFYHYSLAAFTSVFLKAIDLAGKKYSGDGMHIPS